MEQRQPKGKKVQNLDDVKDDDGEKDEKDNENQIDQTEQSDDNVPMAVDEQEEEIVDSSSEDIEQSATDSTIDNSDEGMNPQPIFRPHLNHQNLAPYRCNICKNYVRGGVITICGHLFCWTCLWPVLDIQTYAMCPRCLRRLNLHEDILPFHGDGPYATPSDNNVIAQPGDVPRPSGFYINHYSWDWFSVNEYERAVLRTIMENERERNLYNVLRKVPVNHPIIGSCIKFLTWLQYLIAIWMFVLWGMFGLH